MEWKAGHYILCISQGDNCYYSLPTIGRIYTIASIELKPQEFVVCDYEDTLFHNMGFKKKDFVYLGDSKELTQVEKVLYNVLTSP